MGPCWFYPVSIWRGMLAAQFHHVSVFGLPPFAAKEVNGESNDRQNDEQEEKDFGNFHGPGRYAAEPEDGGHEGNDEKYDGVVEHGFLHNLPARLRPLD